MASTISRADLRRRALAISSYPRRSFTGRRRLEHSVKYVHTHCDDTTKFFPSYVEIWESQPLPMPLLSGPCRRQSCRRPYYYFPPLMVRHRKYHRDFSKATAKSSDSLSSDQQIEKWSKQRLANTTNPSDMKVIVGDIAVRLGLQWDLLEELHQLTRNLQHQEDNETKEGGNTKAIAASMTHDWWSYKDDRRRLQRSSQALETVSKNIQSIKRLHLDTQKQCRQFHQNFPNGDTSNSDDPPPLFQHQLGQAHKEIYSRHALTIETMAEIVIDLRGVLVEDESMERPDIMEQVQSIVTTFLKCRLMTQLLCDHIVDCTMHANRKPNGSISVNVNVHELVESSVFEARHLVEGSFIHIPGDSQDQQEVVEDPPEPPHVFVGTSSVRATLVRPWLQYAFVELLKNSLAITMERNRRSDDASPYWPLYVRLFETEDHVVVEVLDQGGGLQWDPRENGPSPTSSNNEKKGKDLFEFANRRDKWDRLQDQQTYAMVSSPIRGLGVGLALSRLHLRQFGGDLILTDRSEETEIEMDGATQTLQSGLTATMLLAKNFDAVETDIS